ncbi:MAG: histidine phosphatase family protein [Cyanobacteriota bacterium]|nr:histidine phosphatase family protein [Cyanobacteriota bacterium]
MVEVELLLLRHGIAEPRGSGLEDGARALTDEGRRRTRLICRRAGALGLTAPVLVSSPLLRASQTAELAVEAGLAPSFSCHDGLSPGADPLPLLQQLGSQAQMDSSRRWILVGHEPDLGDLACRLLGAPPGGVALKKAGLAMLRWHQILSPSAPIPSDSAQLVLLLTPRILMAP